VHEVVGVLVIDEIRLPGRGVVFCSLSCVGATMEAATTYAGRVQNGPIANMAASHAGTV